ncbi:MAG: hypothetical protein JWL73_877 [Actinomycetia bacterium]|nr:hypothetical protein [Actinomycetes bacterium]
MIGEAARWVVAGVLVVSGVSKLASRSGSKGAEMRALGVPTALAPAVAVLLPFVELGVALLLLVVDARWPTFLALALLTVFAAVVAVNLQRGRRPSCRCFGSLSDRPLSPWTLVRNGWLVALGAVAIATPDGPGQPGWLAAVLFVPTVVLLLRA